MTIATEFHNWSDEPSEEARQTKRGSPALMRIRDYHLARWGGISLSTDALYNPRPISGGTKLSAHAGCAVDLRWETPGPGRSVLLREILPFYIDNSQELHIQAIHDYVGCRVWRAHRSHDQNGGWKTQEPGSHGGNMGNAGAQWVHLEVNRSGWGDDRSVEEMLGIADGAPVTDLMNGKFGLFPLNRDKPRTKIGDKGAFVLYAQCVIFHKAGGAIGRDSEFGQQTKTRVMDVQGARGLEVDGIVGPNTWQALDDLASR